MKRDVRPPAFRLPVTPTDVIRHALAAYYRAVGEAVAPIGEPDPRTGRVRPASSTPCATSSSCGCTTRPPWPGIRSRPTPNATCAGPQPRPRVQHIRDRGARCLELVESGLLPRHPAPTSWSCGCTTRPPWPGIRSRPTPNATCAGPQPRPTRSSTSGCRPCPLGRAVHRRSDPPTPGAGAEPLRSAGHGWLRFCARGLAPRRQRLDPRQRL